MISVVLGESADGPTIPSVRHDGSALRDCLLRDCGAELRRMFEDCAEGDSGEGVDVSLLLAVDHALHELDAMELLPAAPATRPNLFARLLRLLGGR